jgi:hypothetical protein
MGCRLFLCGFDPMSQKRDMGHPVFSFVVSHPFAKYAKGWGTGLLMTDLFILFGGFG